jgi:hypothetical protein
MVNYHILLLNHGKPTYVSLYGKSCDKIYGEKEKNCQGLRKETR